MKLLFTRCAVEFCGTDPVLYKKDGLRWFLHILSAPFSLIFICFMVIIIECYNRLEEIIHKTSPSK